ncbi:MAG: hypothetical protein ACI9MR_004087, partial [Myxococcota bacterium]
KTCIDDLAAFEARLVLVEQPAALSFDGATAVDPRGSVAMPLDVGLGTDRSDRDIECLIDDDAKGPFTGMRTQDHHSTGKIGILQVGHRDEQTGCNGKRHGGSMRSAFAASKRAMCWLCMWWLFAAGGTGCASGPEATPTADPLLQTPLQVRLLAAEAVLAVPAALDAGDLTQALRLLDRVWRHREVLADDRVLRDLLTQAVAAAGSTTLPAALAEGYAVQAAQTALAKGDLPGARRVLAPILAPTASTAWTQGRAWYIAGLAELTTAPINGKHRLTRVANLGHSTAVGREISSLARTTLAAFAFDAGDHKAAIAAYLRVPAESGYWRQARYGLALSQLRAGRAEPALKILALLPEGLAADPERATVAAMAAHTLGLVEAAHAIVDGAIARAQGWRDETPTVSVIRAIADAATVGRSASESLAHTVAATPSVAHLATELRLAGAMPDSEAVSAYRAVVASALKEAIAREVAFHHARVEAAVADLKQLRPQLR